MRFLTHPRTKQQDPMLTLACITVGVCLLKFLFEGISMSIFGHTLSLGHTDATTYGAILAPVLGAHSAREWKIPERHGDDGGGSGRVDNPDLKEES